MDNLHLRSIILKIQDRLSKDDRIRLHFYLGDDVPRRLRDDPSLAGTLNLMESLFDQDKINNDDFSYLINAFDNIHCVDAAKLLRAHLNRVRKDGLNQSMQSLSLIMPLMLDQVLEDQEDEEEEDKQAIEPISIRQENADGGNNVIINSNTINNNQNAAPIIINGRKRSPSGSRRTQRYGKCLLSTILVTFIIHTVVIFVCYRNHKEIRDLKTKYTHAMEMIKEMKLNHTHTVQLLQELKEKLPRIDGKTNLKVKREWKEKATTVAGGNGGGSLMNQLSWSRGIFVDTDKTIYITDAWNDRIVQWKWGAKRAKTVAGGNGEGNQIDQLNRPTDVLIDKRNNALIVADRGNNRVMKWSMDTEMKQEILIPYIGCWGLAMDKDGSLYVSDHHRHLVKRWKQGNSNGTIVAGGNGQGDALNQLDGPAYIFVDDDYSLYISDENNQRVMKWMQDAKEGIVVAGGYGQGNGSNQFSYPQGLFVDRLSRIYVADFYNSRVMRWTPGSAEGEIIIGKNGVGSRLDQLDQPAGLAADVDGNLYILDQHNYRVQKLEKETD